MQRFSEKLDHVVTGTLKMGYLYPMTPLEVFPGESFNISYNALARFLPQISPTMHDVSLHIETHEVPLRQLFDKLGLNWDDFLTGGEDGNTDVQIPTITTPEGGYNEGSLADWLGLPCNYHDVETNTDVIQPSITVSALPVLAYMHIINERYRDQNFIKKLDFTKYQEFIDGTYQFEDASGNPLGTSLFTGPTGVFPRSWHRDYFGRATPWSQRGPQVQLPLGGTAPMLSSFVPVVTSSTGFSQLPSTLPVSPSGFVEINGFSGSSTPSVTFRLVPGSLVPIGGNYRSIQDPSITLTFQGNSTSGVTGFELNQPSGYSAKDWYFNSDLVISNSGGVSSSAFAPFFPGLPYAVSSTAGSVADVSGLQADLQSASAASVLMFRLAARMQQFGEKMLDAGARAVEYTLKFFGVRVPDTRIQRPIYHGAKNMKIAFSEVLQTSDTTNGPVGNLAGHGISGGESNNMHIKVVEHGYIMTFISVMPRSQFHTILPKLYLRKNRYDIPNPIFSTIGEQDLDAMEIDPIHYNNPGTRWGFVPRYSELTSIPSTVHGNMKDTYAHWHMARIYPGTGPVLSANWRYEPVTTRTQSVTDEDSVQVAIGCINRARRVFGTNPRKGIHVV